MAPTGSLPRGQLHKLRPGTYDGQPQFDADGNPLDGNSAAGMFVCGEGDLATAIAFEDFPPPDVRADLPPHDVCRVCFPEGTA
jgi:hypothetical protein